MLRLAWATDPPAQVFSDTLKWHSRNLVLGVDPELGQTVDQLERRARPVGRPAQQRLRHVHRRGHGRAGADRHADAEYYTLGHLARFVQPGRGPDRQHVVRHDRLERPDHGRRIPEPDGSTVLVAHNENDNPARSPSPKAIASFDLHAARRCAGDIHVAWNAEHRVACARPVGMDGHRKPERAYRPVLPRRCGRGRRRR